MARTRRDVKHPGLGMVIGGILMMTVAVFVLLGYVVTFIFDPSDSLVANLFRVGTSVMWVLIGVSWLYGYRTGRRRQRGWVVGKVLYRKQPTYIGKGQRFAPDAWAKFLQRIASDIYPVTDADGKPVARTVLAARLNTHVGLVNDLYPLQFEQVTSTSLNQLAQRVLHANRWQRFVLQRRISTLYRRAGWLDWVVLNVDANVDDAANLPGYIACGVALRDHMRLPAWRILGTLDDMARLHYILLNAETSARVLTDAQKPFGPDELEPFVRRWYKSYQRLMRDTANA